MPVDFQSANMTQQAIRDISRAIGVDCNTYFDLLEQERSAILHRLPGVTV